MGKFTFSLLFALLLTMLPGVLWGQAKRILCLGNSITQGNTEYASYRFNLWKKLIDAELEAEFIGSHDSNNGGLSPAQNTVYKGETFTNYNEGHWGWSTDQVLYGNNEEPGAGKLSDWLANYTPDIVLMHLGTNDMFRDQPIDETLNELREVITQLRAKNPNVTILLSKLIPANGGNVGPPIADNIVELNERIPEFAQSLNTAASEVILVDQFTGFDPTPGADTWDGVHPNEAGEEKMAQRWFEALESLFIVPMPVQLTSFDATVKNSGLVELTWETASEKNNLYFEVQRSPDSILFEPIGRVDGAGTTSTSRQYTYLDTAPELSGGTTYYRLKQVDSDGKSTLSKVVSVKQTINEVALQVYPTHVIEQFVTASIQAEPGTYTQITVFSTNGKEVYTLNGYTNQNGRFKIQIDTELLDGNGLYIMKGTTQKQEWQRKFIVDR